MVQLHQTPASCYKFSSRPKILRKVFVELKKLVRKDKNVRVLWEEVEGMEKNVHIRNIKSSTNRKWQEFFTDHSYKALNRHHAVLCFKLWCV